MAIPHAPSGVPSASLPAAPSPQMQSQLRDHIGRIRVLRPGLQVHADDLVDAQDFQACGEIERGLRIVMLLEGTVDVSYGGRRVQLRSTAGASAVGRSRTVRQPRAMLVSIAQTDCFERRARRGSHARRLSVGMDGAWLDQMVQAQPSGTIAGFCDRHLAMHQWQPSIRITAMAEQIVSAPALGAPLLDLYIESRVLELVSEALSSLDPDHGGAQAPESTSALLPHEHRRVRALHAFLQTDQAFDLSLDDLAREAGTNTTTLQKHFRVTYGTTIFDFVRECRLQRAREVLERDGVTVGQAAVVAGYTSAANFATAYRRRFGIPPKLARSRF